MKYPLLSAILFMYCIGLFTSCNNTDSTKTTVVDKSVHVKQLSQKIDTNVILRVGNENFTLYELKKHFKAYKQKFFGLHRIPPGPTDIKLFINEFVERAYAVADARAKGYHERKDLQTVIESTATSIVTQTHGLLEQMLMSNSKVSKTADLPNAPPNMSKEVIAAKLQQRAISDYHARINKLTALKLDTNAILKLYSVLSKRVEAHEITEKDIDALSNDSLASYYTPYGTDKVIDIVHLAMYYNNLPIRSYLKNTDIIKRYLQDIAASAYIMQDAKKMGILQNPEYKLNKKNFTDNIVYRKYQEEQLTGNAPISEKEILKVYDDIKKSMVRPTNMSFTLFSFSSIEKAIKAKRILEEKGRSTGVALNALSEKRHIKFNEKNSNIPDTLKKILFRMQPGQSSFPIKTNDYYTIIALESAQGSTPMRVDEIRPYLMVLALEKRRANNLHLRMSELEMKYPMRSDIDAKLLSGI